MDKIKCSYYIYFNINVQSCYYVSINKLKQVANIWLQENNGKQNDTTIQGPKAQVNKTQNININTNLNDQEQILKQLGFG